MKIKQHFITFICCLFSILTFTLTPNTTYAKMFPTTVISAIQRSDSLRWYYKEENGHIYKRLFNCSTNTWVGDWILVK